jgi:hypothetical protein
MKTYDEICKDPNASPMERELALLNEYNEALKRINKAQQILVMGTTIRERSAWEALNE